MPETLAEDLPSLQPHEHRLDSPSMAADLAVGLSFPCVLKGGSPLERDDKPGVPSKATAGQDLFPWGKLLK